ncbi:MAG: hypothetical protein AB1646_11195 [Thermodesulfobacteriota bacterium]
MARKKSLLPALLKETLPTEEEDLDLAQAGLDQEDSQDIEGTDAEDATTQADEGVSQTISMEQLLEAHRQTNAQIVKLSRQLEQYERLFAHAADPRPTAARVSNAESYLAGLRAEYEKDPFHTVHHMVSTAFESAMGAAERKVAEMLVAHRMLGKRITKIADDPSYPNLKQNLDKLEHLVLEKGMDPEAAAQYLADLVTGTDDRNRKISEISEQVRNRSALEEAGASTHAPDKVKEFEKRLNSAKSLGEMFDMVRKFKL